MITYSWKRILYLKLVEVVLLTDNSFDEGNYDKRRKIIWYVTLQKQ